jgi:hypothetical protein
VAELADPAAFRMALCTWPAACECQRAMRGSNTESGIKRRNHGLKDEKLFWLMKGDMDGQT